MNPSDNYPLEYLDIPKFEVTIKDLEGENPETRTFKCNSIVFFNGNVINMEKKTPDVDVQMGVVGDNRINNVIFMMMPGFIQKYIDNQRKMDQRNKNALKN